MAFLSRQERREANAFAQIGYTNPFLPERLQLEKQVLGDQFESGAAVIHFVTGLQAQSVFRNFHLLLKRSEFLASKMRKGVLEGICLREEDQQLYRETVLFFLYGKHFSISDIPLIHRVRERTTELSKSWTEFQKDYEWYLDLPGFVLPNYFDAAHCFSIFFQIDRAFSHIFEFIIGSSMPIAKLRAAIWESIFTHDMRRYIRGVHRSMGDITTLITGSSGTGKELVARAIGLSRYRAFHPKTKKFEDAEQGDFFPLNLSALSSTLIESELFGHCKGSFTGAVRDRKGWLEVCGQNGTVFLDEIGELDHSIQVKLLRVLQSRTFSPVGDTAPRRFLGKFVTATNRNLAEEIHLGRFREDLYYRLCADIIQTPSLKEQLADRPAELLEITRYIARRLLIELPDEADSLAIESAEWVEKHIGQDHDWPGNIRELEQCVRNVLIRKSYLPPHRLADPRPASISHPATNGTDPFIRALLAGEMTLDEVAENYISLVYSQVGRYDLASKKLGINWRTLKKKVKQHLVHKFKP